MYEGLRGSWSVYRKKTTQIDKNSIRTLKLHLSNDVVMEMKVEIGHRGGYFNAWF